MLHKSYLYTRSSVLILVLCVVITMYVNVLHSFSLCMCFVHSVRHYVLSILESASCNSVYCRGGSRGGGAAHPAPPPPPLKLEKI